jgi:cytochrome c-type biogenesis protein CcmH
MMRKRVGILLVAGLGALGLGAAEPLEARARRLEGKLMAPCCMANTVAEHNSQASEDARREIRSLLAAGRTDQEVLDTFVARYGSQILSAPPAQGFHLLAWLVPPFLLAGGAAGVVALARRWRLRAPALAAGPGPELDPRDAERVRRELDRLDA